MKAHARAMAAGVVCVILANCDASPDRGVPRTQARELASGTEVGGQLREIGAAPGSAPASSPYLRPDGSVDYEVLRQRFGEPNRDVVLNPRATDVAQEPGALDVVVLPDRLLFPPSAAPWLLTKQPGDALYCNHACGGSGFVRRVLSVNEQAGNVVVATETGGVTDIVQSGWIHGEMPFGAYGARPAPRTMADEPVEPGRLGLEIANQFTFGDYDVTSHSFSGSTHVDYVIAPTGHLLPEVEFVAFRAVGAAELAGSMTIKASSSDAVVLHLLTAEQSTFHVGSFLVGPVEVGVELEVPLNLVAKVESTQAWQLDAEVRANIDVGFVYTAGRGAKDWFQYSIQRQGRLTQTESKGTFSAALEIAPQLNFKVYELAGPFLGTTLGLGVEGEPQTKNCASVLSYKLFDTLAASVGGQIELPHLFTYKLSFQPFDEYKGTIDEGDLSLGAGCTSGCCDSTGACQPGTAPNACGNVGATCSACGAGECCVGGVCTSTGCCNASNCSGCCDANGVCQSGSSDSACGTLGGACSACAAGECCGFGACSAGACSVDAGSDAPTDAGDCISGTWVQTNGTPSPCGSTTVTLVVAPSGGGYTVNGTFNQVTLDSWIDGGMHCGSSSFTATNVVWDGTSLSFSFVIPPDVNQCPFGNDVILTPDPTCTSATGTSSAVTCGSCGQYGCASCGGTLTCPQQPSTATKQ
jgi:hypothetical protein